MPLNIIKQVIDIKETEGNFINITVAYTIILACSRKQTKINFQFLTLKTPLLKCMLLCYQKLYLIGLFFYFRLS